MLAASAASLPAFPVDRACGSTIESGHSARRTSKKKRKSKSFFLKIFGGKKRKEDQPDKPERQRTRRAFAPLDCHVRSFLSKPR
jgi:hypothetical protein